MIVCDACLHEVELDIVEKFNRNNIDVIDGKYSVRFKDKNVTMKAKIIIGKPFPMEGTPYKLLIPSNYCPVCGARILKRSRMEEIEIKQDWKFD